MTRHPTLALCVAALAAAVLARADERRHSMASPTPPGGDVMLETYAGSPAPALREFRGRLVCLRCDLQPGPDAMERCAKEGHRHALSMDGDAMIHPLLAGSAEVVAQINSGALHGKEVVVHGRYYPSTGAIFADRVEAAAAPQGGS